jgi:dipeptidase
VWSASNLEKNLVQRAVWATPEFMNAKVVGYLPEVAKTFALVEGGYGIMNEMGVAIGESTCSARWFGMPPRACPTCEGPLVDIAMLTLIALERCATARCAIETMGGLARSLGYYAADVSAGEGGEALTVVDSTEAWMFHILPDSKGTGAIWVAQRLERDHITVVANAFVIRKVDPANPNFIHSPNLWSEAEAAGLWSKKKGDQRTIKSRNTTPPPPRPFAPHESPSI